MVFDRFNFMTPSLILFCVFIWLFCHFLSLAVKVLSWFMQLWSKFCDFLSAVIFWNMLWSTSFSVMLRVLRVLARTVLSVTLCYLFLCSQCLSRWFYKKLVFLLFYNGDIIPVSAFLYFFIFLNRVILTCARLSTNTTVIQPGNKTATFPLASPHVFPRTRHGHIYSIHASQPGNTHIEAISTPTATSTDTWFYRSY